MCVCVCVWFICVVQRDLCILNMEKHYRNKIIIIFIINHYVDPIDFQTDLKHYQHQKQVLPGQVLKQTRLAETVGVEL